ncbi:2-phosphosulfolactate phosphatase [Rubrivirga sp.]|uniref:2-phosphosulfolactate phosphatase n=1 Tax=Rubrivirga sp. TaxID=1885344 RepID=UPI003B51D844
MSLSVALHPGGLDPESLDGRAVVVVDVLRASTTIVTALANGARAVIPVADEGEAGRLAATLDREATVLGGERGGRQLAGFALGNSPSAYTPDAVAGRTVVLTTTNGTAALVRASGAARLAVGALVNAAAAAVWLGRALDDGLDATVVCAGWQGRVALEDALCAGLLVDRLVGHDRAEPLDDGARIALGLYRGARDDLARALFGADHTRRLVALGAGDDVAACARLDTLDVVPVYRDRQLVAGQV